MVFGFVFSTALARSEKADEKANTLPKENKTVQSDDKQVPGQPADQGNGNSAVNQNKIKTQVQNAGEDKNIKTSSREALIDKNSNKKDEKIKEVGQKISKGLKDVASREPELEADLVELAEDLEENQVEVAGSVKKFENQNKAKTFLMGTDYKNLGQLRSSMVQNRNQIRQLTQLIDQTEDGEIKTALQEELRLMAQEREDINNLIKEEESTFSLFGWAFRLINGYSKETVDTEEELELQEEVEEALAEDAEQLEEDVETEPETVF